MSANLARQNRRFLLLWAVTLILFFLPLRHLASLSLHDESYTHIILIPLISLALIYLERASIFRESWYCRSVGMLLLLPGILLSCIAEARSFSLNQNDRLSIEVLALVLVWIAGFVLCYGPRSFRAAIFPLFFLLLMVPLPQPMLDEVVLGLQKGSAEMTYALFKLFSVPVFWQGFKFSLPGIDIEIAKECSGIRSTVVLFITGLLAGHVFLQSGWRKIILSLTTIPIAIFKNAIRIVTISSLGVYVDQGFLYGKLHHQGGLLFALVSFAILIPFLFALQKSERHTRKKRPASVEDHPVAMESAQLF